MKALGNWPVEPQKTANLMQEFRPNALESPREAQLQTTSRLAAHFCGMKCNG